MDKLNKTFSSLQGAYAKPTISTQVAYKSKEKNNSVMIEDLNLSKNNLTPSETAAFVNEIKFCKVPYLPDSRKQQIGRVNSTSNFINKNLYNFISNEKNSKRQNPVSINHNLTNTNKMNNTNLNSTILDMSHINNNSMRINNFNKLSETYNPNYTTNNNVTLPMHINSISITSKNNKAQVYTSDFNSYIIGAKKNKRDASTGNSNSAYGKNNQNSNISKYKLVANSIDSSTYKDKRNLSSDFISNTDNTSKKSNNETEEILKDIGIKPSINNACINNFSYSNYTPYGNNSSNGFKYGEINKKKFINSNVIDRDFSDDNLSLDLSESKKKIDPPSYYKNKNLNKIVNNSIRYNNNNYDSAVYENKKQNYKVKEKEFVIENQNFFNDIVGLNISSNVNNFTFMSKNNDNNFGDYNLHKNLVIDQKNSIINIKNSPENLIKNFYINNNPQLNIEEFNQFELNIKERISKDKNLEDIINILNENSKFNKKLNLFHNNIYIEKDEDFSYRKFLDEKFPPTYQSFFSIKLESNSNNLSNYGSEENLNSKKMNVLNSGTFNNIIFKRPTEIFENFNFDIFNRKLDNTLYSMQENFINPAFNTVLNTIIKKFPFLIYRIFRTNTANYSGYYEVCLFINNKWQIIYVDDFLPYDKKANIFYGIKENNNLNKNEIWKLILEKAIAKTYGGYMNFMFLDANILFNSITGFNSVVFENNNFDLFDYIMDCLKNNFCLCAKYQVKQNNNIENEEYLTIVDAFEVIEENEKNEENVNYRILKLRKPFECFVLEKEIRNFNFIPRNEKKILNEIMYKDNYDVYDYVYISYTDFKCLFDCLYCCMTFVNDENLKRFKNKASSLTYKINNKNLNNKKEENKKENLNILFNKEEIESKTLLIKNKSNENNSDKINIKEKNVNIIDINNFDKEKSTDSNKFKFVDNFIDNVFSNADKNNLNQNSNPEKNHNLNKEIKNTYENAYSKNINNINEKYKERKQIPLKNAVPKPKRKGSHDFTPETINVDSGDEVKSQAPVDLKSQREAFKAKFQNCIDKSREKEKTNIDKSNKNDINKKEANNNNNINLNNKIEKLIPNESRVFGENKKDQESANNQKDSKGNVKELYENKQILKDPLIKETSKQEINPLIKNKNNINNGENNPIPNTSNTINTQLDYNNSQGTPNFKKEDKKSSLRKLKEFEMETPDFKKIEKQKQLNEKNGVINPNKGMTPEEIYENLRKENKKDELTNNVFNSTNNITPNKNVKEQEHKKEENLEKKNEDLVNSLKDIVERNKKQKKEEESKKFEMKRIEDEKKIKEIILKNELEYEKIKQNLSVEVRNSEKKNENEDSKKEQNLINTNKIKQDENSNEKSITEIINKEKPKKSIFNELEKKEEIIKDIKNEKKEEKIEENKEKNLFDKSAEIKENLVIKREEQKLHNLENNKENQQNKEKKEESKRENLEKGKIVANKQENQDKEKSNNEHMNNFDDLSRNSNNSEKNNNISFSQEIKEKRSGSKFSKNFSNSDLNEVTYPKSEINENIQNIPKQEKIDLNTVDLNNQEKKLLSAPPCPDDILLSSDSKQIVDDKEILDLSQFYSEFSDFRKSSFKAFKYFKDLKPKIYKGEKFFDSQFPSDIKSFINNDKYNSPLNKDPNKTPSLFSNAANLINRSADTYDNSKVKAKLLSQINTEDIIFKRASEVLENFSIINRGIENLEFTKSLYEQCLYCVLCCLANYPQIIFNLIRTLEINDYGYYEVNLYIDGIWQIFYVDDFFPFSISENKFIGYTNIEDQLWPMLIEKAFAKACGGYYETYCNDCSKFLSAFTGMESGHVKIIKNEIFDFIYENIKKKSLLICNTKDFSKNPNSNNGVKKDNGLLKYSYYYVILDAFDITFNYDENITNENNNYIKNETPKNNNNNQISTKLLKIGSPWEKVEFEGEWSINSKNWEKVQKQKFFNDSTKSKFGYVYLTVDEFIKNFDTVFFCILNNFNKNSDEADFSEDSLISENDKPDEFDKVNIKDLIFRNEKDAFSMSNNFEYWNNQKINSFEFTKRFSDPFFLPNDNSLFSIDKNSNDLIHENARPEYELIKKTKKYENIIWRRISDFEEFQENIEKDTFTVLEDLTNTTKWVDEFDQTPFDTYFQTILVCLLKKPSFVDKLIRTKKFNKFCYYEVILFIDNQWKIVFVDDYIPYDLEKNEYLGVKVFVNNNNKDIKDDKKPIQIWPLILQKAWAKVCGGYLNLSIICPSVCYTALTGFESGLYETCKMDLFQFIYDSLKNGYYLIAKTKGEYNSLGAQSNFYYVLTNCFETNQNGHFFKLLKIRSPWKTFDWSGQWCLSSSIWEEDKKQIMWKKSIFAKNGFFILNYEEFVNNFDCLFYCFTNIATKEENKIVKFQIEYENINNNDCNNNYNRKGSSSNVICASGNSKKNSSSDLKRNNLLSSTNNFDLKITNKNISSSSYYSTTRCIAPINGFNKYDNSYLNLNIDNSDIYYHWNFESRSTSNILDIFVSRSNKRKKNNEKKINYFDLKNLNKCEPSQEDFIKNLISIMKEYRKTNNKCQASQDEKNLLKFLKSEDSLAKILFSMEPGSPLDTQWYYKEFKKNGVWLSQYENGNQHFAIHALKKQIRIGIYKGNLQWGRSVVFEFFYEDENSNFYKTFDGVNIDSKKQGEGKYFKRTGLNYYSNETVEVNFNNNLVQSGKFIMPDGCIWAGPIKNDIYKNGLGTIKSPDEKTWQCTYNMDVFIK